VQVVIAEHHGGVGAERAHEAQGLEGLRAAIDESPTNQSWSRSAE
jgi:hypothetical protein